MEAGFGLGGIIKVAGQEAKVLVGSRFVAPIAHFVKDRDGCLEPLASRGRHVQLEEDLSQVALRFGLRQPVGAGSLQRFLQQHAGVARVAAQ